MSTDLVKLAERMENIARHMTYNTEPESIWKHGLKEIAARLASMQTEAPAVPKEAELDEFHRHEALDRSSLFVDMIARHLLDHAFVKANPSIQKSIGEAVELLAGAYQAIGTSPTPAASS